MHRWESLNTKLATSLPAARHSFSFYEWISCPNLPFPAVPVLFPCFLRGEAQILFVATSTQLTHEIVRCRWREIFLEFVHSFSKVLRVCVGLTHGSPTVWGTTFDFSPRVFLKLFALRYLSYATFYEASPKRKSRRLEIVGSMVGGLKSNVCGVSLSCARGAATDKIRAQFTNKERENGIDITKLK